MRYISHSIRKPKYEIWMLRHVFHRFCTENINEVWLLWYRNFAFPVLQGQFRYYRVDAGTAESTFRNSVDSSTTASIPVLRNRLSDTTKSIPVLQNRFVYWNIGAGMAESVQGTEKTAPGKFIRAPKIVFGTITNGDHDPVKVPTQSKIHHREV